MNEFQKGNKLTIQTVYIAIWSVCSGHSLFHTAGNERLTKKKQRKVMTSNKRSSTKSENTRKLKKETERKK